MAKQIIIVDDETGMLELIDLILRREGFSVLKAQSARQALELLGCTSPDLFILDVMMPETDGFELCRKIRTIANFKHTPVIFLSARSDAQSLRTGYGAGGNDFISKVHLHERLVEAIYNVLGVAT